MKFHLYCLTELYHAREASTRSIMRAVETRNSAWYSEEVTKLEHWADDLQLSLERELKDLTDAISEARRDARSAETLSAKLAGQQLLKRLEQRRTIARRSLFDAQDQIGARREDLISAVERQLALATTWSGRFIVRWQFS